MLVMHNNQQSLLTILQVLLYDPLYNWTLSQDKAHQLQQKQQQRDIKKNNNNNSPYITNSGDLDTMETSANSGKLFYYDRGRGACCKAMVNKLVSQSTPTVFSHNGLALNSF